MSQIIDSILKTKLTRPGWPLLILLISEIMYDLISIEVRHRLLRPPNNNYSEPPSGGSDFSTFEFPSIFCYFNIWSKLTDWKLFHKIEWLIVGELNVFCRSRFKTLISPEGSYGIFLGYISVFQHTIWLTHPSFEGYITYIHLIWRV